MILKSINIALAFIGSLITEGPVFRTSFSHDTFTAGEVIAFFKPLTLGQSVAVGKRLIPIDIPDRAIRTRWLRDRRVVESHGFPLGLCHFGLRNDEIPSQMDCRLLFYSHCSARFRGGRTIYEAPRRNATPAIRAVCLYRGMFAYVIRYRVRVCLGIRLSLC